MDNSVGGRSVGGGRRGYGGITGDETRGTNIKNKIKFN